MGAKFSVPQLNRNKSLSTFGRSSQRSLFQKTKNKLRTIEKNLESSTNHDEIRNELDLVEKELLAVSNTIKEKNKDKYEELVNLFMDVKDKVPEKRVEVKEIVPETVAEEIVTNQSNQTTDDEVVEIRNPVELYERPASPSIKFGVQVMPIAPRVSQELLKRSTLPNNDVAKAEFQEMRGISGDVKVLVHSTTTTRIEQNGKVSEFTRTSVEERPISIKSDLNQVEKIRKATDQLESTLKYFHGTKNDEEYESIHYKLVQNLAKLDNIESQDNPVIKQEKKILTQRIQELLKILERIAEPVDAAVKMIEIVEEVNPTGTAI